VRFQPTRREITVPNGSTKRIHTDPLSVPLTPTGSPDLIVAVDVERALLAELPFEAPALPAPDRVALDLGAEFLL